MPNYRIKSGDADVTISTEHDADFYTLSVMAVWECYVARKQISPMLEKLGKIIEVSGGQYAGDETMYLSTKAVLSHMGMAERPE